jgi:hypothetical protein
MYVWQIKIVQLINDVEIVVNIVDFKHVLLLVWIKKVPEKENEKFHTLFLCLVVRTDALKGRRGRLPSKPKSPSSRQPNSFQTQFCRFYNDSTPNPASHDFSKLNVSLFK